QASARRPSGECPAEVEGVELDDLSTVARMPPPAGGSSEHERERLTMPARPLANDISHKPAVVRSGHHHVTPRCARDIQSVHPSVARKDGVDKEAVLPTLRGKRWILSNANHPAHQTRGSAPGTNSLCRDAREADHQLGGCQLG